MSVQKASLRRARRSPGTGGTASILLLLLLAGVHSLVAQDGPNVYGPPAPRNAGFVRVLHNDEGAAAGNEGAGKAAPETFQLGPRNFGPLGFGDMSPYRPVPAGIYLLRRRAAGEGGASGEGGGAAAELVVQGEDYTTLVLGTDAVRVMRDTRHEDPARAQLVFYNLSDAAAELGVAEGGDPVFPAVPAGQSASRTVNAVTVRLEVRRSPPGESSSGDGAEAPSVQVDLRRGESFGLVLLADGELRVHRARVRLED